MKTFWMLLLLSCHVEMAAAGNTVWVSNARELEKANQEARPGDEIILKDGTWQNLRLVFTCHGTAMQPIRIRAEHPGRVIISGNSSLRIGGDYLIIEGLNFINGAAPSGSVWEFRHADRVANHCRITNCQIRDFSTPNRMTDNYWVALYGKQNRVDHCSFFNKTNLGVLMAVILSDDRSRQNGHLVDSNYFGRRWPLGSNGGEIIRIGVSEHCTFYSNTVIKNNLFEYCDGEAEIISVKSCGNKVLNNVFRECQGAVVLRHGNNNTVEGNVFWGNGKEGTGGVRVINEGNWVVNNYFYKLRGEAFRSPLAIMNGVPNSPPHRYLPVKDAVIAHNTFESCSPISMGEGNDAERSMAPENVYFFNNLFLHRQDSVLTYVFSSLQGYRFSGNIAGNSYQSAGITGFTKRALSWGPWSVPRVNVAASAAYQNVLPPAMLAEMPTRLQWGFPNQTGCAALSRFKTLFEQSSRLGTSWKAAAAPKAATKPAWIACNDAEAVYRQIEAATGPCYLTLTGTQYAFSKPIAINQSVTIKGNGKAITMSTDLPLDKLFEIRSHHALSFSNLEASLEGLQVQHFVGTAKDSATAHFRLHITNSHFMGLKASAFFHASKYAYADSISITRTKFTANSADLFRLTEETDNKGYYNVEKMILKQCTFEGNTGSIAHVYRGGNDESTMGPKFFFHSNVITRCTNQGPLLQLHGVQYSELSNNTFRQSNPQAVLVSYTDVVKAKHLQRNNVFVESGRIEGNQYVK